MIFYHISPNTGPQYYDGEWDPYPSSLTDLHGDSPVPHGLRVRILRGIKPGDLTFATSNVISPRFLEVLTTSGATGFTTFPAPLIKGDEQVAMFFGLKVSGRGGAFNLEKSQARLVGGALFGHAAVYMNDKDWDGSDVFFIPGLGISLFVTERIAAAVKKAKLVNVKLIRNDECRFPQ